MLTDEPSVLIAVSPDGPVNIYRMKNVAIASIFLCIILTVGHDKPFCTKAITIIDNVKTALGDTDNR